MSASDSTLLARNSTRAMLKLDNEMHGMNKYICEAKNRHGLTKVFISVIIPGVSKKTNRNIRLIKIVYLSFSLSFIIDKQAKPLLSYSDVHSRSVLLRWRASNGRYDRFNHFIIYYRRLHYFNDNDRQEKDNINVQDYKQILVDPRTTHYSFTFRVQSKKESTERLMLILKLNFYLDDGFNSIYKI